MLELATVHKQDLHTSKTNKCPYKPLDSSCLLLARRGELLEAYKLPLRPSRVVSSAMLYTNVASFDPHSKEAHTLRKNHFLAVLERVSDIKLLT